ncbi:hypothetical protein N7509_003612 [Penicillium cosmopolitanum]|uniref:Uncharacterized protein n=1 Tax=Penicillium cosmopolitanum TaxID=1131564 RepID=A0A9W9W5G6_9EURO|nr:uncharacterized protein N7509_003612 [Penicillium cosmopolitanum]KAJ5403741.1 hypothetical protein N7509_003612 [Penicillium cosmopolitanum]
MDQIGWKVLKFVVISKIIEIMADEFSKLLDAATNSLIRLAFKQWPILKHLSPPDESRTRSRNGRHSKPDDWKVCWRTGTHWPELLLDQY